MPLPPFFVITLPEEPWKEAAVKEQFAQLGVVPTIIHGFHGMLLGLRPTHPLQFDRDGTPEYLHINQTGCALSQLLMLKAAIATGAPEFVCCEDDVILCEGFAERWLAVRAALSQQTDVLQLEYIPVQFMGKDDAGQPAWQSFPMRHLSEGVSTSAGYAHGSACTWWRRESAFSAVQRLRPIDNPFDVMLMRKVYPFFNHALCDPPLATQRTAYGLWPSSIGMDAGKRLVPDPLPC